MGIEIMLEENNIREELQETIKQFGEWLAEIEYNLSNTYNADTEEEMREQQYIISCDLDSLNDEINKINKEELNHDEKYVIERFEQRIETIKDRIG